METFLRTFQKIFAIARTEFRFSLRRGGPVVITAMAGLTVTVGVLLMAYLNMRDNPPITNMWGIAQNLAKAGIPNGEIRRMIGNMETGLLSMMWPPFLIFVPILFLIVLAPTIPSDRQLNANELIRSMPISGGNYLIGKILGVCMAVFLTATIALVLHVVLYLSLIGPVQIKVYFTLSLLNAVPILLWYSAIGVLVGTTLRTRRAAIILGVLLAALRFSLSATGIKDPFFMSYYLIFRQYGIDYLPQISNNTLIASSAMAVLILVVIFALARSWLHWKENF